MQILPPPGPERRQQVVRLFVLLAVLTGVLWWYSGGPAVPSAPTSNQPGVVATAPQADLPVPDALRLAALRSSSVLDEAGRNPFVFGQRQAPSAPGASFLTPPQSGGAVPPPPPPPLPQGPPPIPLRLTGLSVVQAGGRPLVTLKDPTTNALYQAFEGDIVDGRYRVVKVGIQSVVVSYLDGSGLRTLALGG